MTQFSEQRFEAKGICSLSWRDDELVDWVGGGRRFSLGGVEQRASVYYAYKFDAATSSPDGRFAVIYQRLGTKALLLEDGKLVRELNRSYYCADAYEYPVTLFNDAEGRLLLAHCPEKHCQIELEDARTDRALTPSHDRNPSDFFHSRLAANPSGTRLLSAGWVWHPWNAVVTFDVGTALKEPSVLDKGTALEPHSGHEEGSACWLDDHTIVVAGTGDSEDGGKDDGDDPTENLTPRGLAVYDLTQSRCVRAFAMETTPGTMWAIDNNHVLSLFGHPKMIDLRDGHVVHEWHQLNSGSQLSSLSQSAPPPMAFDPSGKRFAIDNGDLVTVIRFG
jgi:hypothetical protein